MLMATLNTQTCHSCVLSQDKLALYYLDHFSANIHRVILAMGLYYYGLRGTNATYSVVFLNLIPIVTSVVAIPSGMGRM